MKILTLTALLFFITIIYPQNFTWQRIYDRGIAVNDIGYDVCKSNGDNYFLACTSNDSLCIIKINSQGNIIFIKMINSGQCLAVASSNDGGCVISGRRYRSFASKIDSLGNLEWFHEYNNVIANYIVSYDIVTSNDNGYILCGYVNAFTYNSGNVFKINNEGIFNTGFIVNVSTVFKSVTADDNAFIVAGSENNSGIIGKIDTSSNSWFNTFKIYGLNTITNSVVNAKHNFVLGAETFQPGRHNVYFVKSTMSGDTSFCKQLSLNLSEYSPRVFLLNENKFVFISNKDTLDNTPGFAVIRLIDSSGNIIKEKYYNWLNTLELFSMVQTNDYGFLFVGWNKDSYPGKKNIYALKTDSLLEADPPIGIHSEKSNSIREFTLYQNYPNPFNPLTKINFDIPAQSKVVINVYDVLGRLVSTIYGGNLNAGKYTADFDASNLATGVYYYELKTYCGAKGTYRKVKKMVVLK